MTSRLDGLMEELTAEVEARVFARLQSAALAPPKLLTVEAAAQRLGIGRSVAFRIIASGQLRSYKIAKHRLVSEADLADYVETCASRDREP